MTTNNDDVPMRISEPGDSNTGLIVGMVVVSSVAAALAVVVVVSLAVIIHLKASGVNGSTLKTTTAVNQAYGANVTLQDYHTHISDESTYYDYPAVDQDDTHINETRLNEAYGVINQDSETATGEDTYSYPATVGQSLPAGTDDGITAKRNEAYVANIVMEKNDAYNTATVGVD